MIRMEGYDRATGLVTVRIPLEVYERLCQWRRYVEGRSDEPAGAKRAFPRNHEKPVDSTLDRS